MNKIIKIFCAAGLALTFTACEDFFNQESTTVIFADKDHLNNATDTIYSVTGIMHKMQAIADRTVLLGEVRGDLVDINDNTDSDLRSLAFFNVSDSNVYNQPKDYYAIINNCNYFLAKADSTLKNNRNETIFQKEIAAVKAFRAWTYLQLVLNYGRVPFVTTPILSKTESEATYPRYDIKQVCDYFISDLTPCKDVEMPGYGTVGSSDSRFFYYPIKVLLGDLNLWAGNYFEAAKSYYDYISTRNGYEATSAYPTGTIFQSWDRDRTSYIRSSGSWAYNCFRTETYAKNSELIFMIPGDSIRAYGNYSELRSLFNSADNEGYTVQLTPSQAMIDLSASQIYCQYTSSGDTIFAPLGLDNYQDGDLRLSACYTSMSLEYKKKNIDYVSLSKFSTRNVHLLRRAHVYLRLAEALNRAGWPRMAFQILQSGLNDDVIAQKVVPFYPADSARICDNFKFSPTQYILYSSNQQEGNTAGIHQRGSGWSEYNPYYQMPDTAVQNADERLAYQMKAVEDLIVDEYALETAFEGQRFYDLMRVALRRNDPAYLANAIYKRRGEAGVTLMKGEVKVDLTNPQNWYLSWKKQIGYNY